MKKNILFFIFYFGWLLIPQNSWAQKESLSLANSPSILDQKKTPEKYFLLAQGGQGGDFDDAYDPFSDYSEFDDASDEEADVNFFRNGRFFTIGLVGGMRSFTENLSKLYSNDYTYGIYLTYFFDFRFALQLGFNTGDHNFHFTSDPNIWLTGNVSFTYLHANLKYYLSTQNITRGLADLNPFFLAGLSQIYRTYTISGTESDSFVRNNTVGVDVGAGLEIPLMRKKAFFGIQGTYHYANFNDRNKVIVAYGSGPRPDGLPGGDPNTTYATTFKPTGDSYDVQGILGFNF